MLLQNNCINNCVKMTPNKRKKKECKSALDGKMKHWSEMRG